VGHLVGEPFDRARLGGSVSPHAAGHRPDQHIVPAGPRVAESGKVRPPGHQALGLEVNRARDVPHLGGISDLEQIA